MKVLITPTSFLKNPEAKAMVEAFADEIVYNPQSRPLEAEEILALLDGVDGYIAGLDYITADVIRRAPASLKVISRYGAGVDRVDLETAKERGITVTNTPGTNAVAVCELAFGLMLSLARSIPRLDSAVKKGEWPRNDGRELAGKTLGIIGFGAIGKNLATRARAFGMRVAAFDPYFDQAFASQHGVEHKTLDEKKGAFIINTARGGLIDEAAAASALKSGQLGGIGLDAYEVEPVTDSPLLGLDHVIMTPHTGAHTNEAIAAMGIMAAQNLIDVLSGRDCKYKIV